MAERDESEEAAEASEEVNWSQSQLQCAKNIVSIERKWDNVPVHLHLAVCIQESGLDDTAVGDSGQSYGPHQIYQTAHPDTWQLALSPWADYAYYVMAQRWRDTFVALGGYSVFYANPVSFLMYFAPEAQGSIAWSHELAAQRWAEAIEVYDLVNQ